MQIFKTACIAAALGFLGANAQDTDMKPRDAAPTIETHELNSAIFASERKAIARFSEGEPIIETYAQSLDPETSPEQILDDAYFLRRVRLDVDDWQHPIKEVFGFGANRRSAQMKVNNEEHWRLHPAGYVNMFFPDLINFDQDTYDLKYEAEEALGDLHCFKMLVTPREKQFSGRFQGTIWVEPATFQIVRLNGTFTNRASLFVGRYIDLIGRSTAPIYIKFDSWRQEVAPGVWMPAYTYFDDAVMWQKSKLRTSYHYRGYSWAWAYNQDWHAHAPASRSGAIDLVSMLDRSGLLASSAQVEATLDAVVNKIRMRGGNYAGTIHCRILLTTPIELFSSGNTIVVSRGLLNVVPNQSVLDALLAREVTRIVRSNAQAIYSPASDPVFDSNRRSDFKGIDRCPQESDVSTPQGASKTCPRDHASILATRETSEFLEALLAQSKQVPHLVGGAFGFSLITHAAIGDIGQAKSRGLTLRPTYEIDASHGTIIATP